MAKKIFFGYLLGPVPFHFVMTDEWRIFSSIQINRSRGCSHFWSTFRAHLFNSCVKLGIGTRFMRNWVLWWNSNLILILMFGERHESKTGNQNQVLLMFNNALYFLFFLNPPISLNQTDYIYGKEIIWWRRWRRMILIYSHFLPLGILCFLEISPKEMVKDVSNLLSSSPSWNLMFLEISSNENLLNFIDY